MHPPQQNAPVYARKRPWHNYWTVRFLLFAALACIVPACQCALLNVVDPPFTETMLARALGNGMETGEWRLPEYHYLPLGEMPRSVLTSAIASEDRKFFSHNGFDMPAIRRAWRAYNGHESGKLIGLITYKDITKTKDRPNSCKDDKGRLRVAAAVGIASDTLQRVEALINASVDAVVIDTAHAHTKSVIRILKEIKKAFPSVEIVAGNIGTAEAAKLLVNEGADALKVGIGPGSICTTRVIAGVGIPQLSAIYNVAKAIEGSGIPVIADGGIRYSGDIIKALASGADSIMAGSLFAGVEESPGETIIYNGRKFKAYRGMGSIEAMQQGSKDRYFQDMEDDIRKLVPEGIEARVPFKGNLSEVIYQMMGGLRAGMGYLGAKNIAVLKKESKFVRITHSGIIESHPHDVAITRESPNYSRKSFE